MLTHVGHNTTTDECDVTYTFSYDALGRRTSVKVGEVELSCNEYQNDAGKPNYGTLKKMVYGNGHTVENAYDDFNRVTAVHYNGETTPRYEYAYNAKGQVAHVTYNTTDAEGSSAQFVTESEYNLSNRPVRVKEHENGKHVYTGEVAYNDTFGILSEFREKVGENQQEYVTTFSYDSQNRPIALNYGDFGSSTTTLDALNRMTYSSVKLGNIAFQSEYHFVAGGYGSGSLTGLVSSITQTGGNCSYGYDDNGNLANATVNGKWAGYTYDALGQLIRVNDRSDTRAGSTGSTWVYEYDRGGNILNKKLYPYADTSSEPLLTTRFTYGNANWKDQLTAVDGVAITYDAIGNPLNDGTWTYTWENGRQLAAMRKSGMEVSFRYNANGLRTHKIVNGVVTKYTLHGKNVVHMTHGEDDLHFFYDAQNRPAVVVYNDVPYAYVKNLQGDVIAILDADGNVVVSYVYDAWGAPIGKAGTLAGTLGTVQPFRYRGYVYDEETGLYYLRSRFYDGKRTRFLNADAAIGLYNSPLAQNQYTYCENYPIYALDSDGYGGNFGARTKIHNRVCQEVIKKLRSPERDGYTGGGMKVVKEAGAVGFIDVVLTTSLVLEVKRCTCSVAKTLMQVESYRTSTWVGYNVRDINRNQTPEEFNISDYYYDEDNLVWVYYQEIPGGVVLYDYGTEDNQEKYKKAVETKAAAYAKALEQTTTAVVTVGAAMAMGLAMSICYAFITEESRFCYRYD